MQEFYKLGAMVAFEMFGFDKYANDEVWNEAAAFMKKNPTMGADEAVAHMKFPKRKMMHFHPDRLNLSTQFSARQKEAISRAIAEGKLNIKGMEDFNGDYAGVRQGTFHKGGPRAERPRNPGPRRACPQGTSAVL